MESTTQLPLVLIEKYLLPGVRASPRGFHRCAGQESEEES